MNERSTPYEFPQDDLTTTLLPELPESADPAHDIGHLIRVWRDVRRIQAVEGGDLRILQAATILHDSVQIEKNSPLRFQAARMTADKAASVLSRLRWIQEDVEKVRHAIEAHSFSGGVEPRSIEAMILRDADRLDALGLVGVARCFAVSGRIGRPLYDVDDPAAASRPLDDVAWTLDHFPTKLLRLGDGFLTGEGRRLSIGRHEALRRFHEDFLAEITD